MDTGVAVELGIVAAAVAAWAVYHAVLLHKKPSKGHDRARDEWVRWLMDGNAGNDKKNILAVQSLRNAIMTSTLAASLSVLLLAASAAVFSAAYPSAPLAVLPVGDDEHREWAEALRLGAATASVATALLLSCQSVRFLCSVNVLINVPPHTPVTVVDAAYVARLLRAANALLLAAWRCLYLGLCLLLWMAGPVPVLVACLAGLPVLYHLDFPSASAGARRRRWSAGARRRRWSAGHEFCLA